MPDWLPADIQVTCVTMQLEFPEILPINQRRDEIAALIAQHQVVIVAGETGSGKTTQLPKICLSLGLAEHGLIGHTQPRRIAARTVADRIASELKVPLGAEVGYQVRFNDNSSKKTQLKLMTDGVLLAEMQHDRLLKKYRVIIIDEAHERSLNIDFLLGLLKPVCRKRPELKVIITSATIDLEKFSEHFSFNGKPAPIIEVSGRTYPVQTLYQPMESDAPNLADVISNTVEQIIRDEAKGKFKASGDILIFCAGEREIREAAQAIRRAQHPVSVMPLYSRLSTQEQNKVFKPAHRRKVVLATNVAETSITVPGIAYVIDPGVARISRYSFRSKIQRLPIEKISQASANQRQGRCGRVANGVCIRLYSQEDFEQRPEFTQAEILRSNLASVILKMMRLGIKDISHFPFIDRPDNRLLNDGHKLLQELQAIETVTQKKSKNPSNRLTHIGKQMSDLPIDPRFARILVAANQLGCLRDALVLVSVLSIQDPRERPNEYLQAAEQKHKELHHPQSDFFSFLYLWQKTINERKALSNSKFKQLCQTQFWSIARIFEWRELVGQLSQLCKSMGWQLEPWKELELPKINTTKKPKAKLKANNDQAGGFDQRYATIHQALLSGLFSNMATKDVDGEYLATRNRRIHLFPSSSQAKRKPAWLMAGEYLETSRVFAINAAQVNPTWVIQAAQHAVKYSHSAPHYHVRSGAIKAYRKTLLQGLALKDKELVNYANINSDESRQVFIQEALVGQKYQPRGNNALFVAHNRALITDIEKMEAKTRKRNLLINEQQIYAFYHERLPEHISSRAALEKWLNKTPGNQEILKLERTQLLLTDLDTHEVAQFPNHIDVQGKRIHIRYRFNPGQNGDGVTMQVPISVLAPFPQHVGDWLVPGLLREKCIALIKTLPKPIRRNYSPASDIVERVFEKLLEHAGSNTSLTGVLADILYRTRGTKVLAEDFSPEKLDPYYHMNYRVIDTDGSLVEESRDLANLKLSYADAVQAAVTSNNSTQKNKLERHNITSWNFGQLNQEVHYQHQGMTVLAFPMLQRQADNSLSLLIHDHADQAKYFSRFGVIELAQRVLASSTQKQAYKYLQKELMQPKKRSNNANANNSHTQMKGLGQLAAQLKTATPRLSESNNQQWVLELINASLNWGCFNGRAEDTSNSAEFEQAIAHSKHWVPTAIELETALLSALKARNTLLTRLEQQPAKNVQVDLVHEDIKAQLYRLFEPSVLRYTNACQLQQYVRYLKAIDSRLDKAISQQPPADEINLAKHQTKFEQYCQALTPAGFESDYPLIINPHLNHFRIMLEEWRVSIYAQHLKTQIPVSDKRLSTYWKTHIQPS